ncbi:MAG: S-layer homology domain-containing protein [Acidimicrobiales bacterium]
MRRTFPTACAAISTVVILLLSTDSQASVAGFGDIAGDDYYAEAVQWMVDNDITGGTAPGCFSPDVATSRGQVATFIHRVADRPPAARSGFRDVADQAFYADAVGWMVAAGITTGTTPSTFSPERPVTRGELATFLHRAAGSPSSGAEFFDDVDTGDFYADAVGWMVAEGITTGTSPTSFSPDRPVTRGEVAAFLHRAAGSPTVTVAEAGVCTEAAEVPELVAAEAYSFELINQLRVDGGLAPLIRVPAMDAEARDWSATMDRTGVFEHSSLPYGENIAWWSAGSAGPGDAADKMHGMWVNSPPHLANMMNPDYSSIGVGFWRTDGGGWNATHVFTY